MRWTVNRRIWTGFGVALALLALVAAIGTVALRSSSGGFRGAVARQQESLTAAEAGRRFNAANLNLLRYLLGPEERWAQLRDRELAAARAAAARLPDNATLLQELDELEIRQLSRAMVRL